MAAIDQERVALQVSRFFSGALRACFRMTKKAHSMIPTTTRDEIALANVGVDVMRIENCELRKNLASVLERIVQAREKGLVLASSSNLIPVCFP